MQFQPTPYILPLILSTIIAVYVAIYVWQRRAIAPWAMALVVLALACAEWSFGYALEIEGVDLAAKIFWGKIQYIGIVTVPLAWAIFTYSYTTQGIWMTRRNVTLLSIVPFITLLLALTNEFHGLIWTNVQILTVGTFSALDVMYGFWFWVYWVYSNLLLLAGTRAVFLSFKRTKGVFRRQDILLLIAVLTPWVGNVIYVSGLSPIPHLDITPFAFTISLVVFALGIYRFQLGTLAPVARDFVVEKMSDGMIVLDMQGNVVDINPSMQRALGVSAGEVIRLIGQSSKDVFNAWPSLVERYENMAEAQDQISIGEDEAKEWFELNMSPLVDGRDRLLGRVVTVRNITKRKQMEEALSLNEEKYRNIYENVEDVIYETDNQSHLTSISPSIKKRGGYQPEELLGRSVTEFFVHPEQYADLDAQMIKNGSVNDFEALLRRKDGNTVWVSITSHIVFDESGLPVSTEGVLRDISERKQAEDRIRQMNTELERHVNERTSQLQESNAYLTALIETSIALNESLDLNEVLDRILVQVHQLIPARAINVMLVEGEHAQIVRRVGYQGLENIAESLRDYRFPITWPTLHYMFSTRKSLYISDTAGDSRWQNIQGADWVRSFVGAPLVVSDETIGFLNAGHSEPNYLNAKHAFMLESLAHQASVAIHNARLLNELKKALEKEQGMRDQLVHADKLAALGKMVSVIAHEINNPIQTVKNTLYLLEDQIIPGSPAKDYLKMASAESKRISDLVAQLRGTYASGSKAMVPVDVFALLLEVHDLLAPQLKERQVEWFQRNGHRPYTVLAVRNNLKQVFINLCLNAMEAMEADQDRQLTVSLNLNQEGNQVGVGFHNTGTPISDDSLPHIFEPFFTTKKSGTGLGLSISYDIIRHHNGELLVESGSGGVTFTVWLPLVASGYDGDEP
ncbi:MAG TPA: histidine kinase N-terminal 7TM domain-containing protein [Anaerolineales bacterium]|nr:histidine kinase N-terminal 7TM domain-containing protein [Anaerolineales bacterium]